MMLKAVLAAATLAACGLVQVQAQTAVPAAPAATSAAKRELVAKVLQLQQGGIEAMARTLTEQPAVQLMQQARGALDRLPAERRDAVARDIEADVRKYVDEATPLVRDRAVRLAPSTIGALLEERFTEDELKQVIALLESPVNRKFQSLAPEMQKSIGEKLVAETRGEVETKVKAMQQSVANRLGVSTTPQAGAPTAPAASAPARQPARK